MVAQFGALPDGSTSPALPRASSERCRGRSPRVSPISYNAAVSACQKGEQWQRGLSLLREIRDMNMYPDFFVYGSVASMCEQGGQGKLVQSLTREVRGLITAE